LIDSDAKRRAMDDTIFALSSGRLPSGVAVVRLSGPRSRSAVETLAGPVTVRQLTLRTIRGRSGSLIDRGFVVFFSAPASFTGEDAAELHVHGGRAVVAALLQELASLEGLRQAEAGEFAKRAFLNGKLDLTAAEALADLISAETQSQRRLAVENAAGGQKRLYESWRGRLLHARAMVEAELDFADESDVPGSVSQRAWSDVAALRDEIATHVEGFSRAEIIRDGFQVVIVGAPNSGKSSLLNVLARREAAIVSDEPGTTRDPVEIALDLDGIKVVVTDTAGIREGAGKVEAIGIERARERARQAHLVLYIEDRNDPQPVDVEDLPPHVFVGTKADLPRGAQRPYDLSVSVVDGTGLDELTARIAKLAKEATGEMEVMPSRLRHVQHLDGCVRYLRTALEGGVKDVELRAEDLRHAAESLAKITGASHVEELLGTIFSEFCIGK
jgi:tRNA modification GTPase